MLGNDLRLAGVLTLVRSGVLEKVLGIGAYISMEDCELGRIVINYKRLNCLCWKMRLICDDRIVCTTLWTRSG